MPPSTSTRLISAMTSRAVPAGSVTVRPIGRHLDAGPRRWWRRGAPGPARASEHSTCSSRDAPGQQFGDRALADDVAPVDDGHRVARPLHLVEEMRRQHDRAALGHQGQDHVAHLVHAGRVEAVHGLVQDQQLRVPDQAGGDAEPLAHAHRVLRHPVVGAVQDADPLERRPDAVPGRRLACRRQDLQVLPPGQVAVETGLVDDGPHPGQGHDHDAAGPGTRAGTWSRRRRGSGRAAPG